MSLIDPDIVKALANKALRRGAEQTERAVADVEPAGRCAGAGSVPCTQPADFTVTSRDGARREFCRDHLLAFAAADSEAGQQPGLLTAVPPQG